MEKIIEILKNPPKWLIISLITLALGLRLEHEYFGQKFHSDQQYIIICNKAYLNGNDFVSSYSNPADISKSIDRPNIDPELFNYVSTFFSFITQSDFYGIILTAFLSIVLYITAWLLIFRFLKEYISKEAIVPILLITAFSSSPYIYYGAPDLFAKSLLWLAFSFSLGVFTQKEKIRYLSLSSVVLGLVFWSRYAYYPLVPVIPAIYFLLYLFSKEKRYFVYSAISFTIIFLIIIISFSVRAEGIDFFLKSAKSNGANVPYQWAHLQKFNYSFFIQAFVDERFIFSGLKIVGLETITNSIKIILSLSIFSILLAGIYKLTHLVIHKLKENHVLFHILLSIVGFSVVTISMLVYLSIDRMPENSRSGLNWTHVQESRYFAPVFASILFMFSIFAFETQNWIHKKLKRISKLIVYSFAVISFLYYPISKYKLIKGTPLYFSFGETKYMANQTDDVEMLKTLKKEISKSFIDKTRPLFISHNYEANLGELFDAEYGGSVMNTLDSLKTSKDINIIILHNKQRIVREISSLIKSKKLSPFWESEKNELYKFTLKPNI